MSFTDALTVAFSEAQLHLPVQDRINAVESILSHLRREDVQALSFSSPTKQVPLYAKVKPFLSADFYQIADPKRLDNLNGAKSIDIGKEGLQEVSYVLHGTLFAANLTQDQQTFVTDSGFQIQPYWNDQGLCHLSAD